MCEHHADLPASACGVCLQDGTPPPPSARMVDKGHVYIARYTTACALCTDQIVPGDKAVKTNVGNAHYRHTAGARRAPRNP